MIGGGFVQEIEILRCEKFRVRHLAKRRYSVKTRYFGEVQEEASIGKLAIEDHRRHHTSVEGDAAADTDRLNTDALRVPQREVNAIEDADFRRRKAARVYDRVAAQQGNEQSRIRTDRLIDVNR